MASPFAWVASSTDLSAANLNKHTNASGHNMLLNGSFEDFDEGNPPYTNCLNPYGWTFYRASDVSQTCDKDGTTIKDGLASCKVVKPTGGGTDTIYQNVTAGTEGADGNTFTFGAWLWCDKASVARLKVDTGGDETFSSFHTGTSSWQWIAITHTDGGSATKFEVSLHMATNAATSTTYIDGAILCAGEIDFPTAVSPSPVFVFAPFGQPILSLDTVSTTGVTAVDLPDVTAALSSSGEPWCQDGTIAVLLRVAVYDTAFDLTEAYGVAEVASGGTIAHGLPVEASYLTGLIPQVTSGEDGYFACVTAISTTTITVKMYDDAGAEPSGAQTFYWAAKYIGDPQDAFLFLRKKSDADADNQHYVRPLMNNTSHIREVMLWLGLDGGGEFEYSVTTPGTDTFSATVRAYGYLRAP